MGKFEDIKTYQECLDRLVLWAQEQDTSKTDLELDWILACMINRPAPNTIPEIQAAIEKHLDEQWNESVAAGYHGSEFNRERMELSNEERNNILALAKEGELPRIKE